MAENGSSLQGSMEYLYGRTFGRKDTWEDQEHEGRGKEISSTLEIDLNIKEK